MIDADWKSFEPEISRVKFTALPLHRPARCFSCTKFISETSFHLMVHSFYSVFVYFHMHQVTKNVESIVTESIGSIK